MSRSSYKYVHHDSHAAAPPSYADAGGTPAQGYFATISSLLNRTLVACYDEKSRHTIEEPESLRNTWGLGEAAGSGLINPAFGIALADHKGSTAGFTTTYTMTI